MKARVVRTKDRGQRGWHIALPSAFHPRIRQRVYSAWFATRADAEAYLAARR